MTHRIIADECWGAVIDVQEFFLSQLGNRAARSRIEANTANFARLLGYFKIPMVVTIERPIDYKGSLPKTLKRQLVDRADFFEKDFFDLTKEKKIASYLAWPKKKQVIVVGC